METRANRYKGATLDLPLEDIKANSLKVKLTKEEMDIIEFAAYGNVKRIDESIMSRII